MANSIQIRQLGGMCFISYAECWLLRAGVGSGGRKAAGGQEGASREMSPVWGSEKNHLAEEQKIPLMDDASHFWKTRLRAQGPNGYPLG
jgi:hypothetical protein